MRFLVLFGLFSTAGLSLAADKPGGDAVAKASAPVEKEEASDASPKDKAIERMLSERESPEALAKAIDAAKKLGVSEQALLEARFLYLVDRQDDAGISALLPEMLKHKDTFKLEESEIFAVKEDWLAVVEYVEAIDAMQKDDREGFKKHILEAFWLSPRQGAAYAPHIERLRMQDAMRTLRYDFAQEFLPLDGKDKVNLKLLVEDKKAVLIHFWSPTSRECEETMPDFAVSAKEFESKGIAVISVLAENSPKILKDARALVAKIGAKPPGKWIIDDDANPLNRLFRVQGIPMMTLLAPDGRVLFNGSPDEDELWTQLAIISPGIKRPALREDTGSTPGHGAGDGAKDGHGHH